MTKFIFKSNASDLQKISQSIETLQKNILYITYRTDSILKMLKENQTDKGLQKQVDEYFGSDNGNNDGSEDSSEDLQSV